MKKIMFVLPVVLLLAVSCKQLGTNQPAVQPVSQEQNQVYTDQAVQGSAGSIEGSLAYPSEGIPASMKVCALNQTTKNTYCTTKHLQGEKYLYKVGYKIQVPPGQYIVYSQLPERADWKAYYDEAVTCGLKAECKSYKPIVLYVNTNQTMSDINPIDWYNNQ